jgi:hypothetical protein
MSEIILTVTESSEQIISGIPRTIALTTDIPSTIFYTLDGTEPTLYSTIYIGLIIVETNVTELTLKTFASNGVITSTIITKNYFVDILDNTRLPHAGTNAPAQKSTNGLFPFGSNTNFPNAAFTNPAEAGTNIDDPSLSQIPDGYDGSHQRNAFTNKSYTIENYDIVYSVTDSHGRFGSGIGNLPGNVKIKTDPAPSEETRQFSKIFDPKALVIYQDFENEDPTDPPTINRQFFSLEDPAKAGHGSKMFAVGLDRPSSTGTFIRSFYNEREHTMTYYYWDRSTNRWIISKTPYIQTGFDYDYSGIATSKQKGAGFVFVWRNFARRYLF